MIPPGTPIERPAPPPTQKVYAAPGTNGYYPLPAGHKLPAQIWDIQWSHSSLEMAEKCLHLYYHRRIAKTPGKEDRSAMDRGNLVHSAIEHWFKGDKTFTRANMGPLDTAQLHRFLPVMERYENVLAYADAVGVEEALNLTANGKPTGLFADDVRVRAKIDLIGFFAGHTRAFIVDWKTGKVWPTKAQAELYGGLAFMRWPKLQRVQVQFAYFDQNGTTPAYDFTADQREALLEPSYATLKKLLRAYKNEDWPARKNDKCRWCPVKTCQFNPNK